MSSCYLESVNWPSRQFQTRRGHSVLLDWSLSTRASFFNFIKFKKKKNFCCTLFNLSSSLNGFFLQTGSRYFNKSLQTFLFSFEIKTLQPFIFHSNFGFFFLSNFGLNFRCHFAVDLLTPGCLGGGKNSFFVSFRKFNANFCCSSKWWKFSS